MERVRWGIMGAGRIAHTFAQDMPASASGVVQAVAARSGDDADTFAESYSIPTAHAGYEALFQDPNVDAVYVATPHTLHLQHAADALSASKAVLCEKPLTTSAAECQQLMQVADSASNYLMEAMWTWFLPAIVKAKQWVTEGRLGRLVQLKADFGYPQVYAPDKREYDIKLAGGCLLEMGIYPVALAALFTEQDPVSIEIVERHAPNGVEDDVVATFAYDEMVATLATSFRAKLPNWAYIIGEEAYIAIPDFWRASECQLWVLDDMVDRFSDGRTTHGFDYQIDAVNRDLLAGRRQSETLPLSTSLRFQQHMDRMRARFKQTNS